MLAAMHDMAISKCQPRDLPFFSFLSAYAMWAFLFFFYSLALYDARICTTTFKSSIACCALYTHMPDWERAPLWGQAPWEQNARATQRIHHGG